MENVTKKFQFGEFFFFTFPITLQMLLRNIVGITDNFMVGSLGPKYMAGLKIVTFFSF